ATLHSVIFTTGPISITNTVWQNSLSQNPGFLMTQRFLVRLQRLSGAKPIGHSPSLISRRPPPSTRRTRSFGPAWAQTTSHSVSFLLLPRRLIVPWRQPRPFLP